MKTTLQRWSVVAALAILLAPSLLPGQQKTPPAPNNQPETRDADKIYLRFVTKTWDDVLSAVAKQAGKTLVLPDVPPGRLSRYDHEGHSLEQSLQILNHELEPTGFRIMDKGAYLIVLRDARFRPEFSRRQYGPRPDPKITEPDQEAELNPVIESAIQQANWKTRKTTETLEHEMAEPAITQPKRVPEESATTALSIEPSHRSVIDLCKQVYHTFGDHATLIEKGPLNLPAFRVERKLKNHPPLDFTIGIDQPNNRLILVSDEQMQPAVVDLFDRLDDQPKRGVNPPELITVSQQVADPISKSLPQLLAQVQSGKDQGGPSDPVQTPSAMNKSMDPAFQQTLDTPGEQKTPAGPADQPASLNEILDRLRGDVSIESLNDLGLLILRGNEADVEGVMQIIRAIETMSAGTSPEIHLRHLKYVNSEAIAGLLNSVYESVQSIDQRASRTNRRVNVTAIVQPNSVLIVAPALDLEAALLLIDELDQPSQPDREARIFRLKNTSTGQAVNLLNEFYEERGGLGTRLRVAVDDRTNSLIIHANPKDWAEIQKVLREIDQDDSHAVSKLQLFPLKNAVAEELAEFINSAVDEALSPRTLTQQGGQQNNSLNQAKSFVLEFLAGSGSQQELIRSGLLSDIRISADPRTNSLAVIAPARSLPLISALIAALDKPADAVAEVKVFTLTHADAAATLELLQELFDQTGTESPVGLNLAGTADSGSALLPIRFSVDVRSNSILAIGGSDALTVVEAILIRLDNQAPKKRMTTVLRLKNSPATDVADAINQFLESQRELSEIDPELVSAVEQVDREVIVVPETLSNNLLISATPEYYGEVVRIAEQLDAAPAQVIIQALLVEVQLDNLDEFGIELGFQDSILFNRSVIDNIQTITNTTTNLGTQTTTQQIVSQEGAPGFLFNNPLLFPNLGNNIGPVANPSAVGSQGLSNFGVGRVSGDLGYGGLVLSASSESVSVLIRALAQQRNVQVLSRPQIRTVDGQLAEIQVGQRVPIVNGVNITAQGVANPNIEYDEAGIILSVTPRINPDGQIVMEVIAERSAYRDDGVPIFTDATTGNTITSPIKDISVARATVGVSDGQTIVLGGMISETDAATTRKVPWLGDIPVVGRLFRYDSATNLRSELLIFLTPRLIYHEFDSETIKDIEASRIHFFREEAEEIHGPLFGVPTGQEMIFDSVISEDSEFFQDSELMPLPADVPNDSTPIRPSPVPLSVPEIPDEDRVPKTIVPDGSLKPMSHQQKKSEKVGISKL